MVFKVPLLRHYQKDKKMYFISSLKHKTNKKKGEDHEKTEKVKSRKKSHSLEINNPNVEMYCSNTSSINLAIKYC